MNCLEYWLVCAKLPPLRVETLNGEGEGVERDWEGVARDASQHLLHHTAREG